jgi:hypothetical protein
VNVVDDVRTAAGLAPAIVRGVVGDGRFEDPDNARIIYLAVAGLVLLAVALGVGTWYWWRTSKIEHPALGPLEMMGTRTWHRSDFNRRAKRLEAARPANAIHEAEPVVEADELDLDAIGKLEPAQFDDFSDLLPGAAASEPQSAEPQVVDEAVAAVLATVAPDAESAADAERVVDVEPAVDEPAVDVEPVDVEVEPAPEPVKQGIIVIDTAPSVPAPLQLTFAADASDGDASDDADHFDPLLRLNTSE